MNMHSL